VKAISCGCLGPRTTAPASAYGRVRAAAAAGSARSSRFHAQLRYGMLDGMVRISPLILTTKTGRSLKKRYFARLWNEAKTKAGLQSVTLHGSDEPLELHFHDLRGTAVTLLSEAGCTPQQIATITGHSLKTVYRILERYLARTRGVAEQAIFNFENSPKTRFANQLQTVALSKTTRKGKPNAR
jgi:integrase